MDLDAQMTSAASLKVVDEVRGKALDEVRHEKLGASRLDSIELVRGLAALAVCIFHFTKYLWPAESIVRKAGGFGWAGVESFFVISGFIIPYAMYRAKYQYAHYFRFLAKRYLRLAPPYLFAIALALGLWWVGCFVPGYRGEPFQFQPGRFVAHLFFANDLLEIPWLNPVFWTLAVEFQYYVAIGLLFPLLFSTKPLRNCLTVSLLAMTPSLPVPEFLVSSWTLVFLAGIVLAQWRLKCLPTSLAFFLGAALLGLIFWHHGRVIGIASLLTVCLILCVRRVPFWGLWLGQLSYAIYLVHVPIGGRIINLGSRFAESEISRWLVLAAAFGVSFGAAWSLWFTIERSAIAWSSRIKYPSFK